MFVIILLIIAGKLLGVLNSLYQPLDSKIPTHKNYTWNGETAINVVIKNKEISLLHFDPFDKKAILLKIPNETYIEVPKGYGSWRIDSIYELGEAGSEPIGPLLLKDSITSLVGIPIDGILIFKNPFDSSIDDEIKSLRGNPLKIFSLLKNVTGDLTLMETASLFWNISKVREDKLTLLDLYQTEITKSKLLPDQSRVLGVDIVNLDLFIRKNLSDSAISQEDESVAIYNTTNHPGLAQSAARWVSNLGVDVVVISSSSINHDKTSVIGIKKSLTFKRLAEIFAPNCLNTKCKIKDADLNLDRSEINIILGEDFYEQYFQK